MQVRMGLLGVAQPEETFGEPVTTATSSANTYNN
jgi:hypothetical protein